MRAARNRASAPCAHALDPRARTTEQLASIRQNSNPDVLPDFCGLGVFARVLLAANGALVTLAMGRNDLLAAMVQDFVQLAAFAEPLLLLTLLLLCPLSRLLRRLPYWGGMAGLLAAELLLMSAVYVAAVKVFGNVGAYWRHALLVMMISAAILYYLHLWQRAFSPALAESRLQALQARIRPHFLFNSINAVLSLVRKDPKRAEAALEDMADLFRVLMADNRQHATMADEIALCRQYVALEQLRLGDRLNVIWNLEAMPARARIPPLVLQPLLENAIYHGVEPSIAPGQIELSVWREGKQVHTVVRNPYLGEGRLHQSGNRMAVENIRERLKLHFDVEAAMTTRLDTAIYEVHIVLPYRE